MKGTFRYCTKSMLYADLILLKINTWLSIAGFLSIAHTCKGGYKNMKERVSSVLKQIFLHLKIMQISCIFFLRQIFQKQI